MQLKHWGLIGGAMMAVGGAGLWLIVSQAMPTPTLLTGVLLLLTIAVIGLALPTAGYLNQRFAQRNWQRRDVWRVPRQAAWSGLFVALSAWLQSVDLLNWTMVAILVLTLILVETYFLSRDE